MQLAKIKSWIPSLHKLSKFRSLRKIHPEKNYFLITSSGQMATFWLATQLNKHPSIFCTHSYDKPLWGADGKPLMGEEGKRQRQVIKESFPSTLEQFFNEHTEATNKSFIGNAHAFNVDKALQYINAERLANIKIINLIRHPIARINSAVNCFKKEWYVEGYLQHLSFIPATYHKYGRDIIKEVLPSMVSNFDTNIDMQFFIVAVIQEQGTLHQAMLAFQRGIPNIRYEDITTSRETMQKMVEYLGSDLLTDSKWLEHEVSYTKVNTHTKNVQENIQDIYNSWESWQQEIYQHHLGRYKHFTFYNEHNYYDFLIN